MRTDFRLYVRFSKNGSIDSGVFIDSGTQIGNNVKILSGSRVGANCHYHYSIDGRQKSLCGNVAIGNRVQIFGQAGIKNWVTVGDDSIIIAKSGVTRDVRADQKFPKENHCGGIIMGGGGDYCERTCGDASTV